MPDMNMILWGVLLFVGLLVFVFFGQTFLKLGKWLWYGMLHMAVGGVFIYLLNLLGHYVELHIPLNPITALVVGILGFPGLMVFFVVKFFIIP